MNVLDALKKMPDASIDSIVTSPPYWSLRSYEQAEAKWEDGWNGQLGLEESPEEYIKHLLLITAELKRILKPSGTLWFNITDTFASGGGKATEQSFTRGKEEDGESFQPDYPAKSKLRYTLGKSKLMIPEMLSTKMVYEQGWLLRNDIIWNSPNRMPESVTDRFSKRYEHVYFFVKNKEYYFNLDAVREKREYPNERVKKLCEDIYNRAKVRRNQVKFLSYDGKAKTENDGIKADPSKIETRSAHSSLQEFLVAIRQIGSEVIKEHPELTKKEKDYINNFKQTASGNLEGKNPGDIWDINTEPNPENHYASYPTELVRRCLEAGCPKDGIVFDPFMGSGTTAEIALDMGLNCIGAEISSTYSDMIERRTKAIERQKLGQLEYERIA